MAITNKHILLNGGAGFIGIAFTTRLVNQNKVVIFDNVYRTYAYKAREGDVTSLGAVGEARWT